VGGNLVAMHELLMHCHFGISQGLNQKQRGRVDGSGAASRQPPEVAPGSEFYPTDNNGPPVVATASREAAIAALTGQYNWNHAVEDQGKQSWPDWDESLQQRSFVIVSLTHLRNKSRSRNEGSGPRIVPSRR